MDKVPTTYAGRTHKLQQPLRLLGVREGEGMQRKRTLQAHSLQPDVTEILGIGTLGLPTLSGNGISRKKFDYREEIRKGTGVHT